MQYKPEGLKGHHELFLMWCPYIKVRRILVLGGKDKVGRGGE
jgi:hypothetical protein